MRLIDSRVHRHAARGRHHRRPSTPPAAALRRPGPLAIGTGRPRGRHRRPTLLSGSRAINPGVAGTPAAPGEDTDETGASGLAGSRSHLGIWLARAVTRASTVLTLCAITVLLTAVLAGGLPAHAVDPPAAPDLQIATTVQQVFTNIRNWLMGILISVAVLCFTVAGIRYFRGEPEELHKAKTAFQAGVVGFMLAALAPLVVSILESLVA